MMRYPFAAGVTIFLSIFLGTSNSHAVGGAGPERPFDILIAHGHILEGTGSPWYSADIGIRDGKIAAIGRLAGARGKHVLDARGKMVAPGFIDILGQFELTVLLDPQLPSKIYPRHHHRDYGGG